MMVLTIRTADGLRKSHQTYASRIVLCSHYVVPLVTQFATAKTVMIIMMKRL
jgi:hypothetical protein